MMAHRPKRYRLTVGSVALLILHSPYGWSYERVHEEGRRLPGQRRLWCERSWCGEEKCDCTLTGWEAADGIWWSA